MNESNLLEKINSELTLEELSEIAETALSLIYSKLRIEEGFGPTQHCSVMSIGPSTYDVQMIIINGPFGYSSTAYLGTYCV